MSKSRSPLLVLTPLLFPLSAPAFAQADPAPLSAEELIAAHNARILDAMGSIDGVARCPRGGPGDDAIIVCARHNDARRRLPLDEPPEPGSPHRLIAGEAPTGAGALAAAANDCVRACYRPVTVPIIPAIRALGRGLDRLLHPD